MNNNTEIEVKGCNVCPFRISGNDGYECYHPNEETIKEELIWYSADDYSPQWCPLKQSSLTISIKKD